MRKLKLKWFIPVCLSLDMQTYWYSFSLSPSLTISLLSWHIGNKLMKLWFLKVLLDSDLIIYNNLIICNIICNLHVCCSEMVPLKFWRTFGPFCLHKLFSHFLYSLYYCWCAQKTSSSWILWSWTSAMPPSQAFQFQMRRIRISAWCTCI